MPHTPIALNYGDQTVLVHPRQSVRSKRLKLVVHPNRRVELVVPPHIKAGEYQHFLESHSQWLRQKLKEFPEVCIKVPFACGESIPYQGSLIDLRSTGTLRGCVHLEGYVLYVPGTEAAFASKVEAFLRDKARDTILCVAKDYANMLDAPYKRVILKDTRSRWGSCSSRKNLNFSWRLIMAPEKVLRYVVAHEVSHLKEMNHSEKFWSVVASLMPDYELQRMWLKKEGYRLHCYG